MRFLAAALVGLAIVGPMEFLLPAALPMPATYVWGMMLVCYSMLVTLCNLLARPRLAVVNIGVEQLRVALDEVAAQIDNQRQWSGNSLLFPNAGIQLHLDENRSMRTVSLLSTGPRQSESGWLRLHKELTTALRSVESADRRRGYLLAGVGLLVVAWPLAEAAALGGPNVAQRLADLLRL